MAYVIAKFRSNGADLLVKISDYELAHRQNAGSKLEQVAVILKEDGMSSKDKNGHRIRGVETDAGRFNVADADWKATTG